MFSNLFNSEKENNYFNIIVNNLIGKEFDSLKEIINFIETLFGKPKSDFDIDLLITIKYLLETSIISKLPGLEEKKGKNELTFKTFKIGEFVAGFSMKNCCDYCSKILKGKIFRVGLNPENIEIKNILERFNMSIENYFNNYIWEGKKVYENIYSIYENKSLIPNENEIIFPNFPLHPQCDCKVFIFHPEEGYINKSGEICMRIKETEKLWKLWYDENIIKKFPEYKYEIEYKNLKQEVFHVYDIVFTKDNNIINVTFKYDTNKEVLEKMEYLKSYLFENIVC